MTPRSSPYPLVERRRLGEHPIHSPNMNQRALPPNSRSGSPTRTMHPSRAQSPVQNPTGVVNAISHNATSASKKKGRTPKNQHAQVSIDQFWSRFTAPTPGKPYIILPDNAHAVRVSRSARQTGKNALASYDEARAACDAKVKKIVRECRRLNMKYRDPHFDIEDDFRKWMTKEHMYADCLMGLNEIRDDLRPMSVKRVEDIFDEPQFFIDGATANDVRQGKEGDCWFMSALCTLSNKEGLIQKVCVTRDEQVGVYGFVFHRDGEWISEVIDDKLYLIKEDFDDSTLERNRWLELQNRTMPGDEWKAVMQTGSRALYFAQCENQNETWLPLLEKAYAKAHGDYSALESGFVGEGIEDLTGGVTTELFSTDILDKDKFWREELMNVNKQFLFGCGQMNGAYGQRSGIIEKHAYSVMEAREVNGLRLVKLRNPWGKGGEWQGPFADGSAEWTPELMTLLDHKFGDDGVFWISYKDLLRNYQHFDRTRLFGPEWTVTQQWTSVDVPWSVDYLDTKFKFTVPKSGPVVLVLCQLDDRYFRGLEGQYDFHLQFRLHKDGEDDYIVRSNAAYYMKRSVSTELDLEDGTYWVLLKITAKRYSDYATVEDVIAKTCNFRREKLLQVGLSYDMAHAKGDFRELEEEKAKKEKLTRRERKKAMCKKMYEARVREHKKTKLRHKKMDMKKAEKAMKKIIQEAEARAREEAIEELKAQQLPQGITNGNGFTDGAVQRPSRSGTLNGQPRPTSRSTSPLPFAGVPRRRDTLTVAMPRHQSVSASNSSAPDIRVQRASIASGGSLTLSDISDDDLSWNSDLDVPDDDPVEDELSRWGFNQADKAESDEEDEFARDPWNAVCVLGLRIYSEGQEVEIEVVKGSEEDDEEKEDGQRRLDVDDASKDAVEALTTPMNSPISPQARGMYSLNHILTI